MTSKKYILPENIKFILSKYYDGLTTIEEERLLRMYFAENQISESYLSDKDLFSVVNQDEILVLPTREIWDKIAAFEKKKSKRSKTVRAISSIAASILVVFSLSVWYYTYSTKHEKFVSDSYSNPEEAYKAVQKYLGLVSTKLSYAYTELKPIEKLSIPCETIQSFSRIEENFQRLKQLDKIGTTTREFERFSIISDLIVVDKN